MRTRDTRIDVFFSFEDENAAEHRRLAAMSPEERCQEMAVLQERMWGPEWTKTPIEKVASWEDVSW
jgi:hypothetical protein